MNKNAVLILVVIVVLLIGGFWFMNNSKTSPSAPSPAETSKEQIEVLENQSTQSAQDQAGVQNVVELSVDASNYKFNKTELKVKKGDKVKITLSSTQGNHDLNIEGYNVGTKVIKSGQQDSLEFTADKNGSFEYYCSIGTHRQMGMKGTLIVE